MERDISPKGKWEIPAAIFVVLVLGFLIWGMMDPSIDISPSEAADVIGDLTDLIDGIVDPGGAI